MNYLIEYNNKIIGVYNTFNDAEIFILGNLQNNLFNYNVKILTFKSNSCYCTEVKNYYDIDSNNNVIDALSDDCNNKNELKGKLQHEMNILNVQRKKLNEKQNIYDNDLKLFNIFQDKNLDEIPELFKKKFNIIKNLNEINNLNINSYYDMLNNIEFKNEENYDNFEIDTDSEIINDFDNLRDK
jgi:hypothetical protein